MRFKGAERLCPAALNKAAAGFAPGRAPPAARGCPSLPGVEVRPGSVLVRPPRGSRPEGGPPRLLPHPPPPSLTGRGRRRREGGGCPAVPGFGALLRGGRRRTAHVPWKIFRPAPPRQRWGGGRGRARGVPGVVVRRGSGSRGARRRGGGARTAAPRVPRGGRRPRGWAVMAAVARGQPALGKRPGGWGGAAPVRLHRGLFFACRCVNTFWKSSRGPRERILYSLAA